MTFDTVVRGLRVPAAALCLALACSMPGHAQSQAAVEPDTDATPGEGEAPAAVVGPADAAEAEAFFDGLLGAQLRQLESVGATVSLVRNGEVLFAKGYGYADLANGVEVDAETTPPAGRAET